VVVKFRSTRGLPLATRALARRSMVPPTSNSTGIPVFAVNGLATIRSTVSFQFPPQILTTSGSAAWAPVAPASRAIIIAITIPNLTRISSKDACVLLLCAARPQRRSVTALVS
jgi:hypothetical protein